jgi:hypothetical protein
MNDLETIRGGVDLEVQLIGGGTEAVFVRQMPIRQMPQLLAALEDEPRMVELFCDRPEGWSDTLTPESFERLVAEGDRLNAVFFSRWLRRRLDRQERLLPGITEQLAKNAGLPTGSLKSPSAQA